MKVKSDHRSKFLGMKKPEKIRASTVFEPVTSAIPARCSTNWPLKPHIGSEVNLLSSYVPVRMWDDAKYIWNNSYSNYGGRWKWRMIIKVNSLEWRSPRKSGLQRDSRPWLPRIPVRCSTNWAMKPHIGSEANILSSYLPVRSEMMRCKNEIIHIWTVLILRWSFFTFIYHRSSNMSYLFHIYFASFHSSRRDMNSINLPCSQCVAS